MADYVSTWRIKARRVLEALRQQATAEAWDYNQLSAAVRAAYPFGPRQNHPYKIWVDELGLFREALAGGRTMDAQDQMNKAVAAATRRGRTLATYAADPRQSTMEGL